MLTFVMGVVLGIGKKQLTGMIEARAGALFT